MGLANFKSKEGAKMEETSTTDEDTSVDSGAVADSITTTSPDTSADNQPAQDDGDKLDPSKSDDTSSADDDKKSTEEDTSGEKDTPVSKFDDDLDDWISKQKLATPENDEQKQALQDLRNGQREFTRERQAQKDAENAKTLNDTISKIKQDAIKDGDDDDYDDPVEARLAKIEADREAETETRLQSEFYQVNKVTDDQHKAILEIFQEKVDRHSNIDDKERALEYWGSPSALPDLLDLAKAKITNTIGTDAVVDEAARKERERIAHESNANSPGRNAKVPVSNDKTVDDERRERFSNWD